MSNKVNLDDADLPPGVAELEDPVIISERKLEALALRAEMNRRLREVREVVDNE
jgi:hypothetical protein